MDETNKLLSAILAELQKLNGRNDEMARQYEAKSQEAARAMDNLKAVLPPAMKGVLDGL